MAQNARTIPSQIHAWTRFYAQFNTPSSASMTFYVVGAFPSHTFSAAASTLISSHFYLLQLQFISSFNQSIAFIIPLLATFLQLKTNDQNNNTPFATHPTTMLVAISSSTVYYLAYIALLRFPLRRFDFVAHHCLVWSGYASVASLASLLYPDSISPFVYVIFALLPASELLLWLYKKLVAEKDGAEFHVRRRGVRPFLNNVFRVLASFSGPRPQILPI